MIHQKKDKSPMQNSELESLELELSHAKLAVRDLASKIEESNSRSKEFQRKPKWRQNDDPETSVNNEDVRYAEVMKEIEHMKQELSKLKIDMARVLKEKRHADRASKSSNSKRSNLLASVELMKKELEELNNKQALVEFGRIEGVKERESIESRANELQLTVSEVNLGNKEGSPLNTITEEIEGAKRELASIQQERFKFTASMEVVRNELNHVVEETARLQKAEQKRDVTVQTLNSKILRAKAKLESVTSGESRTKTVASNLAVTLEQLTAEAETAKKDKDVTNQEIENIKGEIGKIEHEIDVTEERLEAAMEELKAIKSSESKALGNLRNLIKTTMEARDVDSNHSMNSSMIKITDFEYEYLTGKAGGAAELADKKIGAAQAWVEALKASEKELLMKTEMTQNEISELSIEDDGETDAEIPGLKEKVVGSPRRSMNKVARVSVKRARLQKLRSPASRYSGKSGSMPRGKTMPKLTKLFSKKNVALGGEVV
ncbi:hypothetical protein SSX86_019150 [Deinandra increscens subsp. villosa]|uniref:Uncharacterized protein n=1 Tax=Deinandra increscens subsp. villosa TaxID=3103831 RepID=A0AAP0GU79_9ASTR